MKSVLIAVVSAVQAYLLGSIDTGILVSKFLYHDDVRKYGSGAAGMTNMLRTFGKKAAALGFQRFYHPHNLLNMAQAGNTRHCCRDVNIVGLLKFPERLH